jgi:hypothetical protein
MEDNDMIERLNAYILRGGCQACLVGYLPLRLLKHKDKFKNKTAIVVEDLRISDSKSKRKRSDDNGGIVKAQLVSAIELTCRST